MTADPRESSRPEPLRRLVPVTLLKPVLGAALGIDGGPLFQILAVENLGLSPVAIGTAFGLGLLSLPVQLWAARLPLHRVRRNLQLFLFIAAVQALLLAGLLAIGATGGLAATALVVTVTAEIAISVLFTTAWQPLLSARARSQDRQRLNAFWPAVGRGLLAGVLVVFSAANVAGRAAVLVVLAAVAIGTAFQLRHVTAPRAPEPLATDRATATAKTPIPLGIKRILASFALLNFGALPMWLVYLSEVIWPSADLGLVGAVQTIAVVAALLAWRTTEGPLGRRAMIGTVAVLAGSLALLTVDGAVESTFEQGTVLAVTVAMAGGATYASVALLESAHRIVHDQTSVRNFTLLDVVDSSSLQLGLFIGGLLVAASATGESPTPYVVFVVTTTFAATAVISRTTWLAARRERV